MSRDRSDAIFARIGSYGRLIPVLIQQLRSCLSASAGYRREAHYMRGPGPACREKQAAQNAVKSDQ